MEGVLDGPSRSFQSCGQTCQKNVDKDNPEFFLVSVRKWRVFIFEVLNSHLFFASMNTAVKVFRPCLIEVSSLMLQSDYPVVQNCWCFQILDQIFLRHHSIRVLQNNLGLCESNKYMQHEWLIWAADASPGNVAIAASVSIRRRQQRLLELIQQLLRKLLKVWRKAVFVEGIIVPEVMVPVLENNMLEDAVWYCEETARRTIKQAFHKIDIKMCL